MTSPNQEEFDGVVVAEPLTAIKDPIFLNRFEKAFEEQIMEAKRRALEEVELSEHPLHVPMVPKAQSKRGRKTSSKLLLKVPFSFQPPAFCLQENINLEIALLNRFKEGSWGNYVAKFSAAERLQNWLLEKREGCKDENKNDSKAIWYYHHLPSQQKFRSMPAVINFLVHEDFPPKSGSNKKAKQTVDTAADNQDSGSASRE